MIISNQDIHICKENLALYLKRWRYYPLAFAVEALQADKYWYPTHQQAKALHELGRGNFLAIRSGHGIGKSTLLSIEVLRHLICYKKPGIPCKICVTGPSATQVDDILWSEISSTMGHLLPWLQDLLTQNNDEIYCVESRNDWFASARTARKDNPGAMQGFHGTPLYIFDEAAEIPDEIFEVAMGAMTEKDARAIMMGNPTRLSGYFFRQFHSPNSRWTCMHCDCYDTLKEKEYTP